MAHSQSSQPATYSFLVHSSTSSSHDTPGRFDSAANPKQKRRRTSPRDHAVLEAAYQKNSKPDKHERTEIVRQVELGEKEVQIWFQNRRQNDRRKSKPLQPHELLAHFRNGVLKQAPLQDDSDPKTSTGATTVTASGSDGNSGNSFHAVAAEILRPSSRSSSIHELLNPQSSAESLTAKDHEITLSQGTELLSTPPSSFGEDQATTVVHTSSGQIEHGHRRKRSHDDMTDSTRPSKSIEQITAAPPSLAKVPSFVRLAMTVDGEMKVRTNNDPTPSPPKKRPPPPGHSNRKDGSLRRSQSAVEGGLDFKDINPPIRRIGGAGFGRSRDARTWEFYCDRDAGEALSTQAEAERNGSAIGAINLIRSQSQRSKMNVLSPNRGKQNSRRVQPDHMTGKPKMSRARSSMARLQSLADVDGQAESKIKRARHERSPSGDSDKENWAPGTRSSQNPLRRMQPSAPRTTILQESGMSSSTVSDNESRDTVLEKGTIEGKEKAKGDDLDCIQGLLSLSQGAWR